ncbi:hypothetical protein FOG50_00892 [Hanseniaspora uvarum]|nr:hypothetical protein FOG50_00892 [Hanseniaspora uvarum]
MEVNKYVYNAISDEELMSLASKNQNNYKSFENLSSKSNDYLIVNCIGRGNFGDVYQAIYLPNVNYEYFPVEFIRKLQNFEYDEIILKFLNFINDEYFVAVKIVDLDESDEDIDILCQEIQFLTTLQSDDPNRQNIVKYFKTFVDHCKMWIVMEYCGGGSIYEILKHLPIKLDKNKVIEHLREDQISYVTKEVINSLLVLHDKGSIHRDIKLANILLKDSGQIKLSDFGVSGTLNNTLKRRETFVGTPYWMAPEVIKNGYEDTKSGIKIEGYDEKADYWSLGITIMELVNKKPPLIDNDPMLIVSKIPDLDSPTLKDNKAWKCSKHLINFVECCLEKNPVTRMNGHSLLKQKFIKKYESSNDATLKHEICFVKKLKLCKSLNRLKRGLNGMDIWFRKPRYYKPTKFIEQLEEYESDKENDHNWSFTVTSKTPNLTKKLLKTSINSSSLRKNSAENYTPLSMKESAKRKMYNDLVKPTIKVDDLNSNLLGQNTEDESNDESMDLTSNTSEVCTKNGNVHVYNDILLPVFSDIIKRSVHPETQNDVVKLLKNFHDTEKNQPGFSNVFVEEISYKLNELKLEI